LNPPAPAKLHELDPAEILAGYDAVATLYASIPPLLMWRSWEHAAYRRFPLREPVMDVGCGDGRFFRLVFPEISHVVGVDADPAVADAARSAGVYREIYVCPAHTLPLAGRRFASAFANCSLEHMDHLPDVLRGIRASLEDDGRFLFSVVTDRFLDWAPLPLLLDAAGEPDRAKSVQQQYEAYHHLVNALSPGDWVRRLEDAGFDIIAHVPIVPEWSARVFLFFDQLWHLRRGDSECGDQLAPLFARRAFVRGFRQVLAGILDMEEAPAAAAGAVFYARRRP
jgi:SAM-dependent methyltransferase